jgi:carbon-monoxide dehydrogenase medium subunit
VIPASFDYQRATSLQDALTRLAARDGTKVLAGGQSLIPLLRFRLAQPPAVLDIGGLEELRGVVVESHEARIGALTTLRSVEGDDRLAAAIPFLGTVIGGIADLQVRNVASFAGSLAHADPASDLPPALLVLGARLALASAKGQRSLDVSEYFRGAFQTALEEDELIVAVHVDVPAADVGFAYETVEQPASGYPIAGAAARIRLDGKVLVEAALAFTGLAEAPFLAAPVAALGGTEADFDSLVAAAADAVKAVTPLEDSHAPRAYRAHLARVVARRALARAFDAARGRA